MLLSANRSRPASAWPLGTSCLETPRQTQCSGAGTSQTDLCSQCSPNPDRKRVPVCTSAPCFCAGMEGRAGRAFCTLGPGRAPVPDLASCRSRARPTGSGAGWAAGRASAGPGGGHSRPAQPGGRGAPASILEWAWRPSLRGCPVTLASLPPPALAARGIPLSPEPAL